MKNIDMVKWKILINDEIEPYATGFETYITFTAYCEKV